MSLDIPLSNVSKPVGYLCLFITVVFYGANYLPVKHYDTGDGIVFQIFVCAGFWIVSLINNCLREFPKFYGVQLTSGFIWTLANVNTVGMIKLLGIGLNSVFSTITILLFSWIVARFGLYTFF